MENSFELAEIRLRPSSTSPGPTLRAEAGGEEWETSKTPKQASVLSVLDIPSQVTADNPSYGANAVT